MNIIFLDTETTDIGPNARLVQLAYKNAKSGKVVNEYFKPPTPISVGAMSVHHVTNEMVADKPAFSKSRYYGDLVKELESGVLVAHNAPFDIGILKNEGVEVPSHIDTLRLSRQLIESEQHKLQFLRYSLGLNVDAAAHDALGDIIALEALFVHLKNLVSKKFDLEDEETALQKMFELNTAPVLLNAFTFGKYRGKTFAEVLASDKGYLEWLLNSETQKDPDAQNKEMVYTLKHHLGLASSTSLPF